MRKCEPDFKALDIRLSESNPIRLSLTVYEKKTEAAFDMHYPLEIGILLAGKMRRFYHDWEDDISAGDLWFCGALEPHGFAVLEKRTKAVVLVIHPLALARVSFEEYPEFDWLAPFKILPAERPRPLPCHKNKVLSLAEQMIDSAKRKDAYGKLHLRILLMELLLLLSDGWNPGRKLSPVNLNQNSSEIVYKALNMIFSSRGYLSVENVAESCGINRNSFSALFHKFMGISFPEYALRFRLQQASGELLKTCHTLEEIAETWGFSDKSHFSNRFRKIYGISPNKYRTSRD